MRKLRDRFRQESVLLECDPLELRQCLLLAQLACLLLAQILLFADPCLRREYALEVVDELLYVVDKLDELFSGEQRPLRFLRDVDLSLAPQTDVAHLVAEFGGVAETLRIFVEHDQVVGFTRVLVREFFRIVEELSDMADKCFGLLQLRLWQRTRCILFDCRESFA